MIDWNLVATTRRGRILFMTVPDPRAFLDAFERQAAEDPDGVDPLARVVPVTEGWTLGRPGALEAGLRRLAARRAPDLAGKRLCVRLTLSPEDAASAGQEERQLQGAVVEELERLGAGPKTPHADPDLVLSVQVRRDRAAVGLFTREELARAPRLRAALA